LKLLYTPDKSIARGMKYNQNIIFSFGSRFANSSLKIKIIRIENDTTMDNIIKEDKTTARESRLPLGRSMANSYFPVESDAEIYKILEYKANMPNSSGVYSLVSIGLIAIIKN